MGNEKKVKKMSDSQKAVIQSCGVLSCKDKPYRFGFCKEHFEQFKFGLIKKNGQPVPDYEKKLEHYSAYKAKKNAQLVA